jgi:tripartite ATP-independent transporter DctP family solute receptor
VFKAYVEAMSDRKIKVSIHGAGKLGGERALAEGVQLGTLEMAAITSSVLGNFIPEANVLEVPFFFPSRDAAYKVLDGPAAKPIWNVFEKYGFKATGFYAEVGARDFANTKRPIAKPEDFKGLKFRVHESRMSIEMYNLFGANPVALPFPELFSALQKGVVDGQDLPMVIQFVTKFYEVTKYLTDIEFIITTMPFVANKAWFEKLSPDHQRIIIEGTEHAQLFNRRLNHRLRVIAAKVITDKGGEITKVRGAERDLFAAKVAPLKEKVIELYGRNDETKKRMRDLMAGLEKAIQEAK